MSEPPYLIIEVSPAAFDEIAALLRIAELRETILQRRGEPFETLDLTGIRLVRAKEPTIEEDSHGKDE